MLLALGVGWLSPPLALVAVHTIANVVWIGSLLAVSVVASRGPLSADPTEVGTLARRVYSRLAMPAFVASFMAGVVRIVLDAHAYAHLPWLHVKLTFAAVVIILHHVIGARARRVADGDGLAGRGLGTLTWITLACAAFAVLLGVAKALPRF